MSRVPKRHSHRQSTLQILHILSRSVSALQAAALLLAMPAYAMPAGFVALSDVAPEIVQEIRYAGPYNFTGQKIVGYDKAACWLVREAAEGLKSVDARVQIFGLHVKVWDCYRPVRASQAMVTWAAETNPLSAVERYFLGPMTRAEVLAGRFVSPNSRHNRGSTVDLTLVDAAAGALSLSKPPSAGAHCAATEDAINFGTAHDCFDSKSATHEHSLAADVRAHRALLTAEMHRAGFVNYAKEWWHFTLANPPPTAVASDEVIH